MTILKLRRLALPFAFMVILLATFQNCGGPVHDASPDNNASLTASYSQLKNQIFEPKCVTCHISAPVDLTSYQSLMSGNSVVPGQPESSTLYLNVANGSMPKNSGRLSSYEMQMIYNWILNGALEDELLGSPPILSATDISTTLVNLSWLDQTTNEGGFRLERSLQPGGPYIVIQELGQDITTYPDSGLLPATTYYYRIAAFNSQQVGGYSNELTVRTQDVPVTPPAAPSGLTLSGVTSTTMQLQWQDNSNDETQFIVERSTDGVGFVEVGRVSVSVVTFADQGLAPATKYFYRVKAENAAGSSDYSNIASQTTLAALTSTFTSLNANIFVPKCVSCHSGAGAKGKYNMSDYTNIMTRVKPADSAGSLLYIRTADGSMPKGSPPLSASELNQIQLWIDQGAAKN